jgi:ATP-dependent protease ClpP protease subunit
MTTPPPERLVCNPEDLRELISKHTNYTIERCAQVAEKDGWHKAADAIRKLKDEHE